MAKSKIAKSFPPKQRTKEAIDNDYSTQAFHLGHKMRLVVEFEKEIAEHVERMKAIAKEAQSYAAQPQPTPPSPGVA